MKSVKLLIRYFRGFFFLQEIYMPDYKNAKIYKITCNQTGLTYYGSTTQRLTHRLAQHKSYTPSNGMYCSSQQIFINNDYKIELVEDCPCECKTDLLKKESDYIKNNECVNKRRPYRTAQDTKDIAKQRYADNRAYLSKRALERYHNDPSISKQYYMDNREAILQKVKNRYWTKKHQQEVELQA